MGNCNIIAFTNVVKLSYLDHSKQVLAKNGYKLTNPRLIVLESLSSSTISRNAYDLKKEIASLNKVIDIASIYRTLSLLKSLNLVHEVSGGRFVPCQKFDCANSSHCHYQFTCEKCNEVYEMHLDDRNFIGKISKLFPELLIKSHTFCFSGLCKKCHK